VELTGAIEVARVVGVEDRGVDLGLVLWAWVWGCVVGVVLTALVTWVIGGDELLPGCLAFRWLPTYANAPKASSTTTIAVVSTQRRGRWFMLDNAWRRALSDRKMGAASLVAALGVCPVGRSSSNTSGVPGSGRPRSLSEDRPLAGVPGGGFRLARSPMVPSAEW
jgi:hypothetical protein